MNVTALKISPSSSMRCPTSPPLRRRIAPNTKPPTNAAMKPEPPIGSAIPKARTAPAERHDLKPRATAVPARAGHHDDADGGDARNHSGQDAVADLLEYQPN